MMSTTRTMLATTVAVGLGGSAGAIKVKPIVQFLSSLQKFKQSSQINIMLTRF